MITTYGFIGFTKINKDQLIQFNCGWFVIAVIIFNSIVNIILALFFQVNSLKIRAQKYLRDKRIKETFEKEYELKLDTMKKQIEQKLFTNPAKKTKQQNQDIEKKHKDFINEQGIEQLYKKEIDQIEKEQYQKAQDKFLNDNKFYKIQLVDKSIESYNIQAKLKQQAFIFLKNKILNNNQLDKIEENNQEETENEIGKDIDKNNKQRDNDVDSKQSGNDIDIKSQIDYIIPDQKIQKKIKSQTKQNKIAMNNYQDEQKKDITEQKVKNTKMDKKKKKSQNKQSNELQRNSDQNVQDGVNYFSYQDSYNEVFKPYDPSLNLRDDPPIYQTFESMRVPKHIYIQKMRQKHPDFQNDIVNNSFNMIVAKNYDPKILLEMQNLAISWAFEQFCVDFNPWEYLGEEKYKFEEKQMQGYIQHYLLVRQVVNKQDLYEIYEIFGDDLIIGLEGIGMKKKKVKTKKNKKK